MFLDIMHRLVHFLKNTMFRRLDSSSTYWIQLSRFYLRTEAESVSETLCFLKNGQDDG
jgi:hypothetical protein